MKTCKTCGGANQDHYKFCLNCGADLSADGALADSRIPPRPAATRSAHSRIDLSQQPSESPKVKPMAQRAVRSIPISTTQNARENDPSGDTRKNCPRCGTLNPASYQFCGACGLNLEGHGTGAGYAAIHLAPSDKIALDSQKKADSAIARLTLQLPDGSNGDSYTLSSPEAIIGRDTAPLFRKDPYLSPHHARFRIENNQLVLEDLNSLNGIYIRIKKQEIQDGEIFRIGRELLRFNIISDSSYDHEGTLIAGSPNPGFWGRLSLIVGRKHDGSAFPLFGDETTLGRESGDILFYDDGYVSGTHAKIARRGSLIELFDVGSSNGTYLKLRGPRILQFGDMIVLGQQLFRVDHL